MELPPTAPRTAPIRRGPAVRRVLGHALVLISLGVVFQRSWLALLASVSDSNGPPKFVAATCAGAAVCAGAFAFRSALRGTRRSALAGMLIGTGAAGVGVFVRTGARPFGYPWGECDIGWQLVGGILAIGFVGWLIVPAREDDDRSGWLHPAAIAAISLAWGNPLALFAGVVALGATGRTGERGKILAILGIVGGMFAMGWGATWLLVHVALSHVTFVTF